MCSRTTSESGAVVLVSSAVPLHSTPFIVPLALGREILVTCAHHLSYSSLPFKKNILFLLSVDSSYI